MSKKQMDLFEIPTDLPKPERKKLPHKPRELTRRERAEEAREKRLREKERRLREAEEAKAKRPTLGELEKELMRERNRRRSLRAWGGAALVLAVLALAVLTLLAVFPVIRVQDSAMTDTLMPGDVVAAVRTKDVSMGDIVLFSAGRDQRFIRRVIGLPGDKVYISPEGIVMVNGRVLQEKYVSRLSLGPCGISFPCVVPEGRLFVLSDNRISHADSRHAFPGMIAEEQVIGKVMLRLLPLECAGALSQK
jgi:signal peptidase I